MRFAGIGLRTLAAVLAVASFSACAQTSVPYVGCPGDGQMGPYPAAKGSPKPVTLPPEIANKLAWYEYKGDAGRIGTLGPRDWNCFVTIGSNGETLYVAPEALDSARIYNTRTGEASQGQPYNSPAPMAAHRPLRRGTDGSSSFPGVPQLRTQDHRRGPWPRFGLSFRSFSIRPPHI